MGPSRRLVTLTEESPEVTLMWILPEFSSKSTTWLMELDSVWKTLVFLWPQSMMESLLPSTLSLSLLLLSTLSFLSPLRSLRPLLLTSLLWLLPLETEGRERLIPPSSLEDPGLSLLPLLSSTTLLLLSDTPGSDITDSDTLDSDMELSDTDTDSVWDTMDCTEDWSFLFNIRLLCDEHSRCNNRQL